MSKQQPKAPETLSHHQQQGLRARRESALALPAPGDDWALADVAVDHADLLVLKQCGAVRQAGVETVPVGDGSDTSPHYRWETVPELYAWIRDNLTSESECPAPGCHSTGVRNPRGTEGYTCRNDECDVTFDRETAEELL
jgi:hypothetical protein